MGETPSRFLKTSFFRSIDIVDCLTFAGFGVLVTGVWLEFGTGSAMIVSGLCLMGVGVFALRG
jgi:hypothetical protein